MKYNLSNKVILITGASKGIGKAISFKLGANGARTVLLSRNEEELKKVTDQLINKGFQSIYHVADVSKLEDLEKAVEYAKVKWNHQDIKILGKCLL